MEVGYLWVLSFRFLSDINVKAMQTETLTVKIKVCSLTSKELIKCVSTRGGTMVLKITPSLKTLNNASKYNIRKNCILYCFIDWKASKRISA
jgi:hypothetical protein